MEPCQPSRAPFGGDGALALAALQKNLLGPTPVNFPLEQEPERWQVSVGARNRKLLVLVKTRPPDSLHRLIDVRPVDGMDLAYQGVASSRRAQGDFKRAPEPGVVLENLESNASNRPPLGGHDLGKVLPQHDRVERLRERRDARVVDQA